MREKEFAGEPKIIPTLKELDSVKGREIRGLEPKPEKFLLLQSGVDYEITDENERISSDHKLTDFIVFISPSLGEVTKTVEAPHWRAINDDNVRSKIKLSDEDEPVQEEFFYNVSTKGIGYLKPTAKDLNIEDYDSWALKDEEGVYDHGYKVLGLISKWETEDNGSLINKSEELLRLGLRTELYWGMAELQRIPFQGQMKTVPELKEKKVIPNQKKFIPYEAVRLLKMNNRIAEASESDERRAELFKKAFVVFNREAEDKGLPFPELEIGNAEQETIFFREFYKRMGGNMATLLNIGFDHGYMHSANVTLAAEIVDVGTMSKWQDEKKGARIKKHGGVREFHLKDMRDMVYGLRILIKAGKEAGLSYGDKKGLQQSFFEGFDGIFDNQKAKEQKTNPENARSWMEKIFDTVIIENKNLPSLLHNKVEDWDISV